MSGKPKGVLVFIWQYTQIMSIFQNLFSGTKWSLRSNVMMSKSIDNHNKIISLRVLMKQDRPSAEVKDKVDYNGTPKKSLRCLQHEDKFTR